MKVRRVSLLLVLGLVAVLALAACNGGGAATPTSSAPAGKTYSVDATEFAYSPNTFTAKVGEKITFNVTNKGTIDHTFVILGQNGQEAAKILIAVGATQQLEYTPTAAGDYKIECDIPGHAEAGMTGKLTVSP
jgi:uncharacterized cupredoxin-like copper-binding protein